MGRNLRLAIGLFLALQGLFLLLASGRARTVDELSIHFMSESLAREGTTAVPQMQRIGLYYGLPGTDGQPYSPWGPGQPLVAIPYLALLGPAIGAGLPESMRFVANQAATSLVSGTAAALAVALAFLLARRVGASERASLAAALALALATHLGTYATQAFTEPLLALLAIGALFALVAGLERGDARLLALASALAGGAFLTKFVAGGLLAGALAAGYAFERRRALRLREVLALALPVASAIAAHLALNAARFGHPFEFGHPAQADYGKDLTSFSTPILVGLYGLLLSPGKGLALFAPPVLAALAGAGELLRRRRALAAASAAFALGTLLVYAGYTQWEGGYCFGPRYLVPVLPPFAVALALALDRFPAVRRALVPLALVGLAVQVLGVSTSFLEDQVDGVYYGATFDYRLDYTLRGQAGLLAQYAGTLGTGAAFREEFGLGLDFWFVLFRKLNASPMLYVAWTGTALSLAAAGAWLLARRDPAHREAPEIARAAV